ncbi:MAG: hypothetical protein R3C59_29550 [Planctomycetaceae bacterium]
MESTNGGWSDVGRATVGGVTSVLTPTWTTADTTPRFSWQALAGSSRYILHVQNLVSSNVVNREDNLTSTSFTPTTALSSGNYRVWVKAIGASGNFNDGTWSKPVDFTIAAVSEESPNVPAPLLTSLPVALQTEDAAQRDQVAVTVESSDRDIPLDFEDPEVKRDGPKQTGEIALSEVAATDSPESLLPRVWQQPRLPEWLLFEEQL